MPHAVMVVGWLHGLLFIIYMIAGYHVKVVNKWSLSRTLLAVLASVIPFGPFILDKKILKKEIETDSPS